MKITKFWAKGYRSLRDVTLEPLGDFNIFYGENGAGKSNILDAIQTFFAFIPLAVNLRQLPFGFSRYSSDEITNRISDLIWDDDFDLRQVDGSITLGAILEDKHAHFHQLHYWNEPIDQVEAEFSIYRLSKRKYRLVFDHFLLNQRPYPSLFLAGEKQPDLKKHLGTETFTHLGVTRTLRVDEDRDNGKHQRRSSGTIPDGQVVKTLFAAKNARDKAQRKRFDTVREFLAKHLHRGALDVFMDGETQQLELREQLPEPNPTGADISLDRAGHGVIQLYAIVASILLAEGRLVAIEEPEAHLHAPTLGRQLRALLQQMVQEGLVSQLFIATHSNLFDLDSTGYWDVSLDAEGATQVKRLPLSEIDAHHLYEPGPAKHALAQLLRYAPESEVVYRRPDNTPITAAELLRLLQEDDEIAVEFLRSIHGAALRIVRLQAKKEPTPQ